MKCENCGKFDAKKVAGVYLCDSCFWIAHEEFPNLSKS